MFEFQNPFTGGTFTGTVEELFLHLTGKTDSIFDKEDVVKSYGWHWDKSKIKL